MLLTHCFDSAIEGSTAVVVEEGAREISGSTEFELASVHCIPGFFWGQQLNQSSPTQVKQVQVCLVLMGGMVWCAMHEYGQYIPEFLLR